MEKNIRPDKYEHKTGLINITQNVENNDFIPLMNKIIDSKLFMVDLWTTRGRKNSIN